MIRKATAKDRAALQDIWCAAFGDRPDYAAFVTDHCLELGTVLYHPGGMSCITSFPLTLFHGNKKVLDGAYLYGLATHPRQQKKGFGSLLLARAKTLAPFLLLYPATKNLQQFYRQRGFETSVNIPAPRETRASDQSQDITPVQALYAEYTKDAAKQEFTFLWPFSMFDFAYKECLFRGGYIVPPHFCYPSDSDESVVQCKPYTKSGNTGKAPSLQALAYFHKPVPGFLSEKSTFYFPLD